jgi:hypothetical protein
MELGAKNEKWKDRSRQVSEGSDIIEIFKRGKVEEEPECASAVRPEDPRISESDIKTSIDGGTGFWDCTRVHRGK